MRRLTLAITCLALLPAFARAQAGMSAGFAFESGDPAFVTGYSLAATYSLRRAARLGVRFDAGLVTFSRQGFVYTPPCVAPGCGALGSTSGNALTAVSATASIVLAEQPGRNTFYWMAGLGAYAVTNTPSGGAYRKLGWNAGGGFTLSSNLAFELRYHSLIDPRTTRAFIPITLGFRF